MFSKDFVDITYENASFWILENSLWLLLIYFLNTISFWFVKYLFLDQCAQSKLTISECQLKILLCVVFIPQIRYYGKLVALHKLISIVLQLTNQIK